MRYHGSLSDHLGAYGATSGPPGSSGHLGAGALVWRGASISDPAGPSELLNTRLAGEEHPTARLASQGPIPWCVLVATHSTGAWPQRVRATRCTIRRVLLVCAAPPLARWPSWLARASGVLQCTPVCHVVLMCASHPQARRPSRLARASCEPQCAPVRHVLLVCAAPPQARRASRLARASGELQRAPAA